jgi:hypothetical protein
MEEKTTSLPTIAVVPTIGRIDKKGKNSDDINPGIKTANFENDPFPYRHYVSYHPTCNKILSKKWEERTRALHMKKLKVIHLLPCF